MATVRNFRQYQLDAINNMRIGSILCGGVGAGKSYTALGFYFNQEGGDICKQGSKMDNPRDLYIITTARKRDTKEWESEMAPFLISSNPELDIYPGHKVIVDSWNNIVKYVGVEGAFFIFDEQRVVGNGAWVKAFLKIAKSNKWILLSATPGDKWEDYIPVFVANGFYRNAAEFKREHFVYNRWASYPLVDRIINEGKLVRLRNEILVDIRYKRETVEHHEDVWCDFDFGKYRQVMKTRQWEGEPIENGSKLCYILRMILNSDQDRQVKLLELVEKHPRIIVFYNFDYERDILLGLEYGEGVAVAEWSGKKHQEIPDTDRWIYVAQYAANAEGWNCILTDTIVFFSQNYSYRTMVQACGRINRANTPFVNLYYYHFKCRFGIDLAISQTLKDKKEFNENKYVKKLDLGG